MKKNHSAILLIACIALNSITNIFVYSFLTAHLLNLTNNNLLYVVLFNLITHIIMALLTFLLAPLIKKCKKRVFLIIGVILKFLLMLTVVLVQNGLEKYIVLISVLNGLAEITYWSGGNGLKSLIVTKKHMKDFVLFNSIAGSIIGIIIPIIFGSVIDNTSFFIASIVVLVIAIAQIIISVFIKEHKVQDPHFSYKNFFNSIKATNNQKLLRGIIINNFLSGFRGNLSMLILYMTVLLFKTNISIGIFATIGSILCIIVMFIFRQIKKHELNIWFYIISGVIPFVIILLATFYLNQITLIIFNFGTTICLCIPDTVNDMRRFTLTKQKGLKTYYCESVSISEIALNVGRVAGELVLVLMALCVNEGLYITCLIVSALITLIYVISVGALEKVAKKPKNSSRNNHNNEKIKSPN